MERSQRDAACRQLRRSGSRRLPRKKRCSPAEAVRGGPSGWVRGPSAAAPSLRLAWWKAAPDFGLRRVLHRADRMQRFHAQRVDFCSRAAAFCDGMVSRFADADGQMFLRGGVSRMPKSSCGLLREQP